MTFKKLLVFIRLKLSPYFKIIYLLLKIVINFHNYRSKLLLLKVNIRDLLKPCQSVAIIFISQYLIYYTIFAEKL
jgi:hypothetical protein